MERAVSRARMARSWLGVSPSRRAVGATGAGWFAHIVLVLIFRLAGDGGDARGGFAKCMILKRLKFLHERDWVLEIRVS